MERRECRRVEHGWDAGRTVGDVYLAEASAVCAYGAMAVYRSCASSDLAWGPFA